MSWIIEHLVSLLSLFFLLVIFIALLSPFEALGWWAGWSHRQLDPEPPTPTDNPTAEANDVQQYAVYLTGVGGFSGEALTDFEEHLLALLRTQLPDVLIIQDVFPYSVTNNPLDGERVLAGMWHWLQKMRTKVPNNVFDVLIVVRNVLQVAVSADPRYGPVYNVGVAREVARSLLRHGYPIDSGKPITLIGYSGGAQVSVGAARYLRKALHAPIRVISLGGVISGDPGMDYVEHLYHLDGTKDYMPYVGNICYPGRWSLLTHSPWNNAKRQGRITVIEPGPMTHIGGRDYFSQSATLASGETHAERVADVIARIVNGPSDSNISVTTTHLS